MSPVESWGGEILPECLLTVLDPYFSMNSANSLLKDTSTHTHTVQTHTPHTHTTHINKLEFMHVCAHTCSDVQTTHMQTHIDTHMQTQTLVKHSLSLIDPNSYRRYLSPSHGRLP